MKKHLNGNRDFFDDYTTEGEENSLPAEDNFSRPSKAWWESREADSVSELLSEDELKDIMAADTAEAYGDDGYAEAAPESDEHAPEEYAEGEYEGEPVYEAPAEPVSPAPVKEKRQRGESKTPAKEKKPAAKAPAKKQKQPKEDPNAWAPLDKKKKKTFGAKLGRYLLILLIVFAVIWAGLWVALGRYQHKQDTIAEAEALQQAKLEEEAAHLKAVKRAPQIAFEEWFAAQTADSWAELWYADHPDGTDGKERVGAYLAELFSADDVELCKGLDSTEEAPVFVIKNSEQELARVAMTGSDVNWTVGKAALCLKGDKSASIRVSLGTKVFCNGRELTEEYAGEGESTFTYEPLKDKLENPVAWVTYKVDGMLLEPELTFEAPEGRTITKTADGDYFLCMDSTDAEGYKTKAVEFVKSYLYYYLSGLNNTYGNLYNALSHLYPGSQAYTDLQDTYNGVVWNSAHSEIDTSNATAGGVVIWADNCYSVDVTYDATGTVSGQLDEYAATMRVYFTRTDNGFAITHFETL